jgi:hypothetical protein
MSALTETGRPCSTSSATCVAATRSRATTLSARTRSPQRCPAPTQKTVNAARDYKRKFACRRQVMEEPRESFRRRLRVHEKRATGKSKTRAYMRDSQVARKPAVALPIAGRRRRSTTDVDAPPASTRASRAGAVERAEAARDEREQLREEAGYRQARLALLPRTALRWTSGQPGQAPGAPAGLRQSLRPSPPGGGSAPACSYQT